jgi:hypothetical protein
MPSGAPAFAIVVNAYWPAALAVCYRLCNRPLSRHCRKPLVVSIDRGSVRRQIADNLQAVWLKKRSQTQHSGLVQRFFACGNLLNATPWSS